MRLAAIALLVLAACSPAASTVDWNAVEADIVDGWPPATVNYNASEEFLEILVAPGTSETAARRIACELANPAISRHGGDPDDVTVAVFEEGPNGQRLAVGGGC